MGGVIVGICGNNLFSWSWNMEMSSYYRFSDLWSVSFSGGVIDSNPDFIPGYWVYRYRLRERRGHAGPKVQG